MNLRNDTIIIRDLAEDDIEEVLKIQKESGLSTWSKADYEQEIQRQDSVSKVAVSENGEISGFALVRLLAGINKTFETAEICNIAVRKDFQEKGIGQKIFDGILKELKLNQISEIWLEVRCSNNKAVNFYRKNGFSKRSVRKDYYDNPSEDALIFCRALES